MSLIYSGQTSLFLLNVDMSDLGLVAFKRDKNRKTGGKRQAAKQSDSQTDRGMNESSDG